MSDISEPGATGKVNGNFLSLPARLTKAQGWPGGLAKTVFDKVAAAGLLVFFAPVLAGIALALLASEGGPVLFAHERIGRGGRRFRCLKFRTMVPDAEARLQHLLENDPLARREWDATQKLSDDPRIGCMGHLLRRSSLDELPQLFNVLRGDMSMVGPRPIVEGERGHYGAHMADYLSVRPGITGLWQVSGRSNTTYAERVALDVAYVRNPSLKADIRIMLKTVAVVLGRQGAR